MPASDRHLLRRRLGVLSVSVALLAGLATATATSAAAAPDSPTFGKSIDKLAAYEAPSTCDPAEKPGVVGFRSLVRSAYSSVNAGGISRSCEVGGRSEHKEGRAWDWMLRADVAADRAKADDLLDWLLATDEHGNSYAMARRLGVMYVIWDRQWWSAWAADKGWQPYSGASPHTDHIHFSFSWDGALQRTSWWNGGVPASGPAPRPSPPPSSSPSPSNPPPSDPPPSNPPPSNPPPSNPPPSNPPPSEAAKDPFGALESLTATTSGSAPAVRAIGWAIDPDAATFTSVRLDIGGIPTLSVVADRHRPDVAEANPPYSANHGFEAVIPTDPGTHEVCVTGVNQGTGQDRSLGCRTVVVPGAAPAPAPAPEPAPESEPVVTGPQPRAIENSCPNGVVPSAGFTDIVGSAHGPAVDCAVWWEVAKGTSARTFTPGGLLSRAQIASFLARTVASAGVALPADPVDAFDDDEGSVHELAINQMAQVGVLQGKGDRLYAPDDIVTRAQMATYLVRAYEYRTGQHLRRSADVFSDDDGSVHEENIGKAAQAGFTGGTSATTFSPGVPTTRGQVASFLTRVLDLLVETEWAAMRA